MIGQTNAAAFSGQKVTFIEDDEDDIFDNTFIANEDDEDEC
jgi:hypothetical protein